MVAIGSRPARLPELNRVSWSTSSTMTDINIEYQSASGRQELYDAIAADFANRKPPIAIIVTGGTGPTLACKNATATIPIVFATAGDPVGSGLVNSIYAPGGNVTGISNEQTNLVQQRLSYMHDNLAPDLGNKCCVGPIGNTNATNVKLEMVEVQKQAARLGLKFYQSTIPLQTVDDIRPVMKDLKNNGVQALFVCTDPLITTNADILNEWALLEQLPTMHAFQENFGNEGLMFYGPIFTDMFQRAADFVSMILKDHNSPGQIPVEPAKTFEKKYNKRTAEVLGLKSLAKH
jgi:putative ABC transport system substrate-binding protein